jgi:hypothetical protein
VGDGEGAAVVEHAAAEGVGPGRRDGLIVRYYDAVQGQGATGVPDAAAVVGPAVGDRQPVDAGGDAVANMDDAAHVAAAHPQAISAGAVDGQGVGDRQLTAGQPDGTVQPGREADHVRAGGRVGREDGLTE